MAPDKCPKESRSRYQWEVLSVSSFFGRFLLEFSARAKIWHDIRVANVFKIFYSKHFTFFKETVEEK